MPVDLPSHNTCSECDATTGRHTNTGCDLVTNTVHDPTGSGDTNTLRDANSVGETNTSARGSDPTGAIAGARVAISFTRRRFVGGAGAALAATALSRRAAAASAATPAAAPTAVAAAPPPTGPGILVLVTLYGGNDGLDTVVPTTDPAYAAARGALAIPPERTLRLDASFGLHPSMPGTKRLWDIGRLAIVRGVGYPNPNRSHFRSMDIWQSAVSDRAESLGWLGRWFDATGPDPLRMVHIGPSVPRAFIGTKGAGAAVPAGRLAIAGGDRVAAAYRTLHRAPAAELGPWGARLANSGADALRVIERYGPVVNTPDTAAAPGTSLEGGAVANGDAPNALEVQLDEVMRLIASGAPARVYSVSLGGFDTHAGEGDVHARLLGALDRALSGFVDRVAALPGGAGTGVTALVYSEFGRRVRTNLSAGTDHGTAGPVLVAGPSVRGGFYGDAPSLTDLDDGDLRVTTDFRAVYATILGSTLGIDPSAVLGARFAPVAFL